MNRAIVFVALLTACTDDPGKDTTDTDTDAPTDTDTDVVDTDTTPAPEGALDGAWSGHCTGDLTFQYYTSTPGDSTPVDVVGDFTLTETDGAVAGEFLLTQYYTTTTYTYSAGYRVEGTHDGADVHLEIVGYTSTSSSSTSGTDVSFDLVLAGDALDGDIVIVDYYGVEHTLPCGFTRQ